jgi:hypothetical protein
LRSVNNIPPPTKELLYNVNISGDETGAAREEDVNLEE